MNGAILKSESLGKLAEALSKAQTQIKPATKDATNPHFKSSYADLTSVWAACRAALAANNLSVTQLPTSDAEAATVGMITVLMHSSGEWIGSEVSTRPRDFTPQSVGSAITYLRRYGLASVVGITADDDDGEAAQPANKPRAVPQSRQSPQAAPAQNEAVQPSSTAFWQTAKRLDVDQKQAAAIKDQHTAGGSTDWASAINALSALEAA